MMLYYARPHTHGPASELAEATAATPAAPLGLDLTRWANPTGPQVEYSLDGRIDLALTVTPVDDHYDVEVNHHWVGGRHDGQQRRIIHYPGVTPAELGDCLRQAHAYATYPAQEE